MKKKIVIKVQINCNKCRTKAMKLGASIEGTVDSIAMEGEKKDQLVLIGDDVDPVCLTHILRKKLGYADIIKVEEVKKETKGTVKKPNTSTTKVEWYRQCPPCPPQVIYYNDDYYESRSSIPNICSIM